MKVKVRKRRSPAPVAEEQAKTSFVDIKCILGGEIISNERIVCNRIPEPEFINIIDRILYAVRHSRVKNAKMKKYPDIRISELAKMFSK